MRFVALLLALVAPPVLAQDADIQKLLIQRQQQSDAFNLQLRQSQEALKVAPAARGAMEARQHSERVRLDNVIEAQLREVRPDTPEALRPIERQRADDERRPFYSPIVEVPYKAAPPPPLLRPTLKGNVDVIDAPRPEVAR
jgi:hypothetical protein